MITPACRQQTMSSITVYLIPRKMSSANIANMRISIRRNTKRLVMDRVRNALESDQSRDHSNDQQILGAFEALLGNREIDVKQMAVLLNDETAVKLLNRMTGENIAALMPNEALALARLTAFLGADGKVDKARLDAFRDSFGELDYKAIEQILEYEDLVRAEVSKGNFGGVIFEDPAVQNNFTETELETVKVMGVLAEEIGTFFYVSDDFETGTFLTCGLMAVKPGDLHRGVYYQIIQKVYWDMAKMKPDSAENLKKFLIEKAVELDGQEKIDNEIDLIQKQMALRNPEVSRPAAEDEFCARYFPLFLMKAVSGKRLKDIDIETAQDLQKCFGAVLEHLAEETKRRDFNGNLANEEEKDYNELLRYKTVSTEGEDVINGIRQSDIQVVQEGETDSHGQKRMEQDQSAKNSREAYRVGDEGQGDEQRGSDGDFWHDSEGRLLARGRNDHLAESKVRDADGALKAVYHFTPEPSFIKFARGDIGFHFGTKE